MILLVGLGNPGKKYENNRHNIGFMALDDIAQAHGFSGWKAKFQAEISEGRFGSLKVILLKPQTFMNLSGQSVGEAMRFYKLAPEDVIVIHDELDLAPGKLKCKTGGGHAGHNGLRSIHQHIGADFHRLRLGIGHPGAKNKVASYVLNDFAKADQGWLEQILHAISKAAEDLLRLDFSSFQNQIGLDMKPAKPAKPKEDAPKKPAQNKDSPPEAKAEKSPLQKLIEKFGK